jgi:hypothetical protein
VPHQFLKRDDIARLPTGGFSAATREQAAIHSCQQTSSVQSASVRHEMEFCKKNDSAES